jgi:hypothetical protein
VRAALGDDVGDPVCERRDGVRLVVRRAAQRAHRANILHDGREARQTRIWLRVFRLDVGVPHRLHRSVLGTGCRNSVTRAGEHVGVRESCAIDDEVARPGEFDDEVMDQRK